MSIHLYQPGLIQIIVVSVIFFHIFWTKDGFPEEPKTENQPQQSSVKETDFAADTIELSLKDALSFAVENNLNIRIQGFNPKVKKPDIGVAKGEFDPNLDMNFSHKYKENQTSTQLAGTSIAENRVVEPGFTWTHKLRTGTTYELRWLTDRNSTNSRFVTEDPHYTSELVLEVRQPLLRDFGRDIQEADINTAENEYKSAILGFDMETLIII